MRISLAFAFVIALLVSATGFAQNYPTKPVRLVVPFAPGGGTDIIARLLAPPLSAKLSQPILIENRPGAATILGAEEVAKAPPDGYTLLVALTGTLAINPSLYAKLPLPYDPVKSFAPVGLVATSPNILVANTSVPVRSVKELIALAKSHPGGLNFASSGVGGAPHIAGELFNRLAGINIVQVPYKGAAAALGDVLSGRVSIMFSALPPVLPQIAAGKLRALAITAKQRSELVPQLPTMAQAGVPGFEVSSWFGVLAPAGTDKNVVERLSRDLNEILAGSTLKKKFSEQGLEVQQSSPAEFSGYVKSELTRWSAIVHELGIRPE